MKTKKDQIDNFLEQPHIAFAGYSTNPKKFGRVMFKSLKEKGYNLYPVNPAGGVTPDGDIIYENLGALPEYVKAVFVATKPDASVLVVKDALEKEFTHIWVQQMSENAEVMDLLGDFPVKVTHQCILMHAQPTGIHKFHWWLVKMIGKLPA